MADVFIADSRRDQDFVRRLHDPVPSESRRPCDCWGQGISGVSCYQPPGVDVLDAVHPAFAAGAVRRLVGRGTPAHRRPARRLTG